MRAWSRVGAAAALVLALAVGARRAAAKDASWQQGAFAPAAGGPELVETRVEVGGRTLRAVCTPGPVEVVLLHRAGGGAADWRGVLELLDGSVGACAYDREGPGVSAPAPSPRGWFELADELQAAHRAVGADVPVLVGHGSGGLYARLLAAGRAGSAAGVVLIEPTHEDMLERSRRGVPPQVWSRWSAAWARPNPDGVVERDLADRARRATLPRIPVTVITATVRPDGPGWNPRWIDQAARELQGALVQGHPLGRHVPARGATTDVPTDDPRLVAEEIQRVVGLARARGRPHR